MSFNLDYLAPEVRWTLAAVFIALIIASAVSWTMQRLQPSRDLGELRQRIQTWWVIAGMFSLAIVMNRTVSLAFLAFVSLLALREFLTLIRDRRPADSVLALAYLSVPIQYFWIYIEWYGMFIIFIPVYLFLILTTRMVMTGQTSGFLQSVGVLHWGLMTTVFSLSHAAMLLAIHPTSESRFQAVWPSTIGAQNPGPGLLILLVLLTQCNDVAQYIWGKSFGRLKIVPRVSPGKTLAGLLGGVATTVLLGGLIGPRLSLFDWQHGMLIGLIVGLGGFAGDVSISAIKRDLGVKDSGTMLPGHGGILDRVDSLTYTAPLFFHFVYYGYC